MSNGQKQVPVTIRRLPTGAPGLDEILGGGLPENLVQHDCWWPGMRKDDACASVCVRQRQPERPALYFTLLGEPAVKMLRYQQQFTFFDQAKLDGAVRFINLSRLVLEEDLNAVLEEILNRSRLITPTSSWWTRSARSCAERRPRRPKWNSMDSYSALRCT